MPPRKSHLRRYLAELFGEDSKELIDEINAIRKGKVYSHFKSTSDAIPMMGVMEHLVPTVAERMECAKILLAYQHGKPESTLNVVDDSPTRKALDLDRVSLAELEQMDEILRRAKLPEGEVVESTATEVIKK